MNRSTFKAMLVTSVTVTGVDLSAAVSAIEAETEAENQATYGMVLPGSIPSPIAAQTTVPTALAVGGGSTLSTVVPNSEIVDYLKEKLKGTLWRSQDNMTEYGH
jgi:hypothetical protein